MTMPATIELAKEIKEVAERLSRDDFVTWLAAQPAVISYGIPILADAVLGNGYVGLLAKSDNRIYVLQKALAEANKRIAELEAQPRTIQAYGTCYCS